MNLSVDTREQTTLIAALNAYIFDREVQMAEAEGNDDERGIKFFEEQRSRAVALLKRLQPYTVMVHYSEEA